MSKFYQFLYRLEKKFLTIFPKMGWLRNVVVISSSSALGQLLTVIVAPILTRIYSPSDMGVMRIYLSILGIITVSSALNYEMAIPLPEDDSSAINLLALSLSILLLVSTLVGIAFIFLGTQLLEIFDAVIIVDYVWLLPIGMLGYGIYNILSYWAVREKAYAVIAKTKLIKSLGMVMTQLGLGAITANPIGLIIGELVGHFSGALTSAKLIINRNKVLLPSISIDGVRKVAARYRRFPLLSSWSTLLNAFGSQLPILFISAIYGSEVLGWISLGQTIMVVPLSLIARSVSEVFFGEFAQAANDNNGQLPRLFRRMLISMVVISLPVVILFALLGPILTPIIFGNRWLEAGIYMRILAPKIFFQTIAQPTGSALAVLERQDLHIVREVLRVIVFAGVFMVIFYFSLPVETAILWFSLISSLYYAFYVAISFFAIRKAVT